MNTISENIRRRCKTNIRTTGCSCEADAAAIERLVLAAEGALAEIRQGPNRETWFVVGELQAALALFREVSYEQIT